MHKIIMTAMALAFMFGAAVGHMAGASSPAAAAKKFERIDPSMLLSNARDLRDETVRDAI